MPVFSGEGAIAIFYNAATPEARDMTPHPFTVNTYSAVIKLSDLNTESQAECYNYLYFRLNFYPT